MTMRMLLRSALCVSVLVAGAAPASASDRVVAIVADLPDTNLTDGQCGPAPADAQCSLRAAIQQANAATDPDEFHIIRLPPGNYVLDIPGAGENASATGDLDLASNIIILGEGEPHQVVIIGDRRDRVFHALSGFISIRNVTVRRGFTPGDGGGIFNEAAFNLQLDHVIFENNEAFRGGAVAANAGTDIRSSVLAGNFSAACGGGLWVSGATAGVIDSVVEVNISRLGGGVCAEQPSNVTVHRSRIANNDADAGGGIYAQPGPNAVVTVTGSLIYRNRAHRQEGGGIRGGGLLQISNTEVSYNEARGILGARGEGPGARGGGIFNSGILSMTDSYVHDNRAAGSLLTGGGGIYNAGSAMLITKSTLARNSAGAGSGGGIFDQRSEGAVRLDNTTISGNIARLGGSAIVTSAPATAPIVLNHVTVAENVTTFGAALHGADLAFATVGTVVGQNHGPAREGPGKNCWHPASGTGALSSVADDGSCGFIHVQPVGLDALAFNGGPTPTHALLPGSYAIDLSIDCGSFSSVPVADDQRGVRRPQGAHCDSGAYELRPVTLSLRFCCREALFETLAGTGRAESLAMDLTQAAVAAKDQLAIAVAEQLLADTRALNKAFDAFAASPDPAAGLQQFGAVELAFERATKSFAAFEQCCGGIAPALSAAVLGQLQALQMSIPALKTQLDQATKRSAVEILIARVRAADLPSGLTNSLVKQLEAGSFEAVMHHLAAQRGKSIGVEGADALIADVRILIGL